MTTDEAKTLREENRRLRDELKAAREEIGRLQETCANTAALEGPPPSETLTTRLPDLDTIYEEIKARLSREAPQLIQVMAQRPEIEVVMKRHTITMDGSTPRGRIAALIAEGFFGTGQATGAVRTQLKKRGPDPGTKTVGNCLADLVTKGFLERTAGGRFVAVDGMETRIIEESS